MTAGTALKKIYEAKKRAGRVRELLRSLGQKDERMALTHRYSEVMSAPMDFSGGGRGGEAWGADDGGGSELMQRLQRDFFEVIGLDI